MGLDQIIEPYIFEEDFGPPLSDWEKSDECLTDKFKAEFPDGVVPIRHVPTLGVRTTDPQEWASKMLGRFEAVHAAVDNVDLCGELREQYINADGSPPEPRPGRPANLTTKTQATRGMMRQGLTLRQIARYVGRPLREIIASSMSEHNSYLWTEAYADMDEYLHAGSWLESNDVIGARFGFSAGVVEGWRKIHK